jgi:predicted small secreted protein
MLTGKRPAAVPLLLLCALVLAACGSGPAPGGDAGVAGSSSSSAASSTAAVDDHLVLELDRGEGGEPERYTLTCAAPVAGNLPDLAGACAHLQGLDDPFAALPADQMCTEQYGGPQAARVTGRWAGQAVDLELARTNGCQIAQWDRLGPLLPGPVG